MGIRGIRHSAFRIQGKKIILLLSVICLLSSVAFAAPSCYQPEEAKAEQLLRFHSELMVITVTCKYSSKGVSLIPSYTDFTRKNKVALAKAEAVIMAQYDAGKKGRGVEALDNLRTRLANEFGETVAREKAPAFCARNRDKVLRMHVLSPALVEKEVQLASAYKATYKPLCKKSP